MHERRSWIIIAWRRGTSDKAGESTPFLRLTMNITTLLEMAVDGFPERTAISASGAHLTYRQLHQASHGAARLFTEAASSHAALLDLNGITAPIALYGAAYAGVP